MSSALHKHEGNVAAEDDKGASFSQIFLPRADAKTKTHPNVDESASLYR